MKKSILNLLVIIACTIIAHKLEAQIYTCGQEYLHQQKMAQDWNYKKQYDDQNQQIYQIVKHKSRQESSRSNGAAASRQIPIIIYIMHPSSQPTPGSGTANPTDEQIQIGLNHLNDAFANINAYSGNGHGANDASNPDRNLLRSVPTDIEFCLATRDVYGEYSPGIYRIQSDAFANLDIDTEIGAMKALASTEVGIGRFPESEYCPVFLTAELCSVNSGLGCGIGGYAGPGLGVLNLARLWGTNTNSSKVHIHEFGHYLSLAHTWSRGCENNDCLLDGDRVCDTPPDDSTSGVSCGENQNSCSTDTDSDFFTTDQDDLYENYMDYSRQSCQNTFTRGQATRMEASADSRPQLLNSDGCTPCISLSNTTPTPATISNCASSSTINLEVSNFSNVTTAPNRVVGWWVTKDNPISATATNNESTQNALSSAALGGPIGANANVIYEGMGSDGAFSLSATCSELTPGATYYATPFVSTKVVSSLASSCSSNGGAQNNITFNGFPGKFLSFNSLDISCSVPNLRPNYTFTLNISGYTGPAGQLGINIRQNGSNNTLFTTFSATGNDTYTFTQDNFGGVDPSNSDFRAYVWHQGGNGFQNGNISASLEVNYPDEEGIEFPSIPSYNTCTFGNPVAFTCSCEETCSIDAAYPTAPGTYNSTQSSTEGAFTYYCDEGGNLLLAIDTDADIGDSEVELVVSGNIAEFYPQGTGFITADPGASVMPYSWDVSGTPTNPATVRFFLPNNARAMVNAAIPGTDDDVSALTDFSFYKIINQDIPAHEDISNLSAADVLVMTNGSSASTSQWRLGTIGGKNYAEFQVTSFSGGAGGAGAEGAPLLPVDLISFSGSSRNNINLLTWITASETNNDYFTIERSSDGVSFSGIGRVSGAGTSAKENTYDFTDRAPSQGGNYYRLKQVDFDGDFDYTSIIFIKNSSDAGLRILPNPASHDLKVYFAAKQEVPTKIEIIDIRGRLALVQQISSVRGENIASIDLSKMYSGTYILRLITGDEISVKKLIINK